MEFALICPMLAAGFLSAADLGLALNRRMTMDAMLQAGAASAVSDPGVTKVQSVATYAAGDGVVAGTGSSSAVTITVNRFCACPNALSTAVSCTSTCSTGSTPYIFYRLSADGTYHPILLPNISLHSSQLIQIK